MQNTIIKKFSQTLSVTIVLGALISGGLVVAGGALASSSEESYSVNSESPTLINSSVNNQRGLAALGAFIGAGFFAIATAGLAWLNFKILTQYPETELVYTTTEDFQTEPESEQSPPANPQGFEQ